MTGRRVALFVLALSIAFGAIAEGAKSRRPKKSAAKKPAATKPAPATTVRAKLPGGLGTALRDGSEVFLVVVPGSGDGYVRIARRVCEAGEEAVPALKAANPTLRSPQKGRGVRVPLSTLRGELRRAVLDALWPDDEMDERGRIHVVGKESTLADAAGAIAAWFTGHPSNRRRLEPVGPKRKGGELRRGDRVVIPTALLDPALADEISEEEDVSADDVPRIAGEPIPPAPIPPLPTVVRPIPEPPTISAAGPAPVIADDESFPLEFDVDERGTHAIYRLRAGEALYSSVVVRFTGRVHATDVNELAALIACRSDIENVHEIPIGYPVKIPVDWLTPDWLPAGDARRIRYERALAEAVRFRSPARATSLSGIHVILDSGHGGRDVGTSHGGIWESTYVYDIYCRVKRLLEERTRATVWPTVEETTRGFAVLERDRLPASKKARLLTDPPFDLDDVVAGVHLRWYLANSRLRKAQSEGVSPDRVVFVSLHADSLHPSLKGAMAYVPGERFLARSFGKKGPAYEARKEWRDEPWVSFSPVERFQSEGYSRDLATHLLDAFSARELLVHPYGPVRANVIRKRKEWVPAVLKFNRVPARVLLEVCNMGNPDDRERLLSAEWRQRVAEAIVQGLLTYYDGRQPGTGSMAGGGR